MLKSKPVAAIPTATANTVSTVEDSDVGSAYAKLGVRRGFDPMPPERARFYVLALPKAGKSTFISSMPDALCFDFDDAYRNIESKRCDYVPVLDYRTLVSAVEQLKQDALRGNRRYKHVIFDTTDRYQDLVIDQLNHELEADPKATIKKVLDTKGGKGGYVTVRDRMMLFPRQLYKAGYGFSMIGHLRWVNSEEEEDQYLKSCIFPGTNAEIGGEVDYVMEAHTAAKVDVIPDPRNPKLKTQKVTRKYHIVTRRQDSNPYSQELGARVTLPEVLEVPKTNAWTEVFRPAWEEAARKS